MKEITTKQQAKNAIKWLYALRTHKKTTQRLSDGRGRYCCLGVGAKVLHTGDIYKGATLAPKLCEAVGLYDETGMFHHGVIHGESALTELNDDNYRTDKTFKNIRRDILDNLGKVFRPTVAKILRKHYSK